MISLILRQLPLAIKLQNFGRPTLGRVSFRCGFRSGRVSIDADHAGAACGKAECISARNRDWLANLVFAHIGGRSPPKCPLDSWDSNSRDSLAFTRTNLPVDSVTMRRLLPENWFSEAHVQAQLVAESAAYGDGIGEALQVQRPVGAAGESLDAGAIDQIALMHAQETLAG